MSLSMGIAATRLRAKVPQLSWPRVGLRQTGRLPTCQGWGAPWNFIPVSKNASSWKSYWAHGKPSLSDSNTSSAQSWSATLRMCLRCYTQVQDQTHIHSSSFAYFNCLNSSSKRQTNHDNSLPFNAIQCHSHWKGLWNRLIARPTLRQGTGCFSSLSCSHWRCHLAITLKKLVLNEEDMKR